MQVTHAGVCHRTRRGIVGIGWALYELPRANGVLSSGIKLNDSLDPPSLMSKKLTVFAAAYSNEKHAPPR